MHNEYVIANIDGNITEYRILKDLYTEAKGLKPWKIIAKANGKYKRPIIFKFMNFATPEEALIYVCMYLNSKRYTYKIENKKGDN